ncbi:MAG: hypothetical protein M1536_09240 [Firmicutes bacterium]|nr:hypothetical protein [Bacillota bacterium]
MTEPIGKNFSVQQPVFKAEVKAQQKEEAPLRELSQDAVEKGASSSKEFRKNNEILFSADIMPVVVNSGGKLLLGIDLNGDGKFQDVAYANKEPAFVKPAIYKELKNYLSDARNIDIVTQDNIKELTNIDDIEIGDVKVTLSKDVLLLKKLEL